MKKLLLLFAVVSMVISPNYLKANDDKKSDDEILRKSQMFEPPNFGPDRTSFPMPFRQIGNPVNQPAISTGYYFVDSKDESPDFWRPSPNIIDTTTDPNLWRRILPGPRLRNPADWANSPDGLRFFRNPALPLPNGDFFNGPTDSTDDAIAGPMPIGFNFYFNGLKYDSFYVSTNGIIALTNDRYFYDSQKNRIIPPGATTCYNPMSMDWFFAGRAHNGDGLNDAITDDFGYYYSVCGGNPLNPRGGIRARGGTLNQGQFARNKSALIAPFFGDMHLSNYNTVTNLPEDWGKVFFKRSNNSDRLLIYFINIAPVRVLATPRGNYFGNFDLRPGDQSYVAASAQVILDKRDSSVTIVYERFDGVAIVRGRSVPAPTVFRYNTTVGVHGFARHTNYGQAGGETKPWAGEYEQYTHYYAGFRNRDSDWPEDYLAIKFKQWKNSLRVVDISYRVRKKDPSADLDYTEEVPTSKVNNYELLAGDERNGAIQPVAIIQNLTNEIQGPSGVNYQKQQINFRARFRIINEASMRIVYNRLVPIDSICLALDDANVMKCAGNPYTRVKYVNVEVNAGNYKATELPFPGPNAYNGIPPYGYVQVFFPPFEPNEYINNHLGRMRTYIIADPTHPRTNEKFGDSWPFDDTASTQLFVMNRLDDFNDDVTSYHIVNRVAMPSTLKWVNIDAEVVSGDDVSKYPLPPRGTYAPTNNLDFDFSEPDFTRDTRESPVIRMTRRTLSNSEPAQSPGGDQLRSFPIDLRGRFGAVLSLSIQRTAMRDDWPRGWADQELVGPEPRTVVNANPFVVFSGRRLAASAPPDELTVEFARPSPDGIRYITNIDDRRWRYHPRRDGAKPVTNMPVLSLYGAGGYLRGWLEADRDSALSRPQNPNLNGLRPDIFDDGIDFEYQKFFLAIPDTFIKSENEGAKNFRFRLNMQARNNKKCMACIPDDDDAYFVDNVRILFPTEITDLELSLVKILWPYTIAPASQAIKVPIRVKVSNNTNIASPPFKVKVKIWRKGDYALHHAIYCRTFPVPVMSGRKNIEVPLPNWNARKTGDGEYFMLANLMFGEPNNPDYDLEPANDTNFTFIKLKFGDVFAYDPAQNPRNDVPDAAFTSTPGRGLNLFGFAVGGMGSINGPTSVYNESSFGAGFVGGSGSGRIAMKFTLNQRDTVYGYKAFFGSLNQSFNDISFSILDQRGIIPGSFIYKYRGIDDVRHKEFWNQYVTYLLPKPVVLDAGTYWMAIAQLGETGLELGASKTRVGMRITSVYIPPPVFRASAVGGSGYHLVIDKDFRRLNNTGNLINDNKFLLENSGNSGQWAQFMPTIGNPAYAHLHHFGTSPADMTTLTLSRGTWIPMIRPYFGERTSGGDMSYYPCPDDLIPVELSYFDGISRNNSIELFWETATEVNNEGFYVEKRNKGEESWNSIGFIKGAGNSKSVHHYSYTDKNVQPNVTYQYRLRQVDKDGSLSCESLSKVITLVFEGQAELTLEQNVPNPVSNHTSITYTLPNESNVRLEVVDVFGNVVKTLVNNNTSAGRNTVEWNALDSKNRPVPSGSYIVRLVAGNDVRTIKMTVVR